LESRAERYMALSLERRGGVAVRAKALTPNEVAAYQVWSLFDPNSWVTT
jgi:hypothetical protein